MKPPPLPPAPPRIVRLVPPIIPEPVIVALPGPLAQKQRPAHHNNYSHARRRMTQGIVLHATDGHEGTHKDDDVAAMFQQSDLAKPRSAHYVCDTDSVTCCVRDDWTAWHCGKTGNARLIGLELCGLCAQSRAQWLDALSLPMLHRAARLVADLCREHDVPARVVNEHGLRTGVRGITTHAYVSLAWGESTHTDPGPGFPLGAFVMAVAKALALAPM